METRRIPGTELRVSPITLGTMTFGSPVPFDEAVKLTQYAVDQGINLIDTANMYEGYARVPGSAGGVAEEILGAALRGRRDKVILATKLGMKVGDAPEDEGTSAAAIRKHLDRSLTRLGTDHIDLYYLHKPDPASSLTETLEELVRAKAAGKIRWYGVSNYSAGQLRELLDTAKAIGAEKPVICQPPLSLLKQDALADLVPLCEAEGIAVTPYQVLQGGLLTGKYRRGMPLPAGSRGAEKPDWLWQLSESLLDRLEDIGRQADAEGLTMTQYAIRWTLRQPAVVSTIVGVKTRAQIDQAVAAAI